MADQSPLEPTTTLQQDLVVAGQRHIIAILVTVFVLVICAYLVGFGAAELRLLAFSLLSNVFFLVVGTYFQRTNHTKTGGVMAGDVGR